MTTTQTRPGPLRYIAYSFGRPLPDSMRDWVRNDLTGDHATLRHVIRSFVPYLPGSVGVFFLLPGPLWLRGAAALLPLLLALDYSCAFRPMDRRRRLAQHGLPEDLENAHKVQQRERERVRYEQTWCSGQA